MINTNLKAQQKGSVLATTTILMVIAALLILSASSTALMNQRVINNSLREKQAFQAAEAGIEYSLMYGKKNLTTISLDEDGDGFISYTVPVAVGSKYTAKITNPTMNNFDIFEITSVGTSNDGTVSKTMKQECYRKNILSLSPPAALVALGNVDLTGNVEVSNPHDIAIWSGGGTSIGGSTDVFGAVKANDAYLAALTGAQFFNNFFNNTKEGVRGSADLLYVNNSDTNYSSSHLTNPNGLSGVEGKIIYISQTSGTTARINSDAIIGSPEKPVILIVDGDFKLDGNATIYGAVYVTGNWYNAGGGSSLVKGAIIVQGDIATSGTPRFSFDKSTDYIQDLFVSLVKIPGTWRDF